MNVYLLMLYRPNTMRLPEHQERAILLEKRSAEFTFENMVKHFRKTINSFPDRRTVSNTRYSIEDAALGAFSVYRRAWAWLVHSTRPFFTYCSTEYGRKLFYQPTCFHWI